MRHRILALLAGLVLAVGSASSVVAGDFGFEVSIDAGMVVGRTGEVTVTGSVSCTEDLGASVEVQLAQVVGRFHTIRSVGSTTLDCLAADGRGTFSISLLADEGKFAAGPARISAIAFGYVCDPEVPDGCLGAFDDYGPASIQLGGSKK